MYKFFLSLVPLLVSACTSQPSVSNSEMSLVQPTSNSYLYVSKKDSKILSNEKSTDLIELGGKRFLIDDSYFSANGHHCKRLVQSSDTPTAIVYCQSAQGWFKVNVLTASQE